MEFEREKENKIIINLKNILIDKLIINKKI
jgi:hypothetical protein